MQTPSDPGYSVSASGCSSVPGQVLLAKELSPIRSPDAPTSGEKFGLDIRSSAFKGYVVFFRYRDDLLEIVNVIEGHRDIDGHFEPTRQE